MAEVAVDARGRAAAMATDDLVPGVSAFDWSSVAGGAVIAASLAFLLLTFGAAAGFSFISPWTSTSSDAKALGWVAAGWFLIVSLLSYLIGGYAAARLRAHRGDGSLHESQIRDGLHGMGVWAVGIIITVLLAWAGTTQLGSGAAKVGQAAGAAVGGTAVAASSQADTAGYLADMLFRRDQAGNEVPATNRAEMQRILAHALESGSLPDSDRQYLTRTIAAQAGLDQAAAEQRVNDVVGQVQRAAQQAKDAAKEAADKARKAMALGGFLTAAGFMIALAAAWIGAQAGGRHREEGRIFRPLTPRLRPRAAAL